jgi:glycerol-3-phosphate dehydrogenase
MLRDLALRGFDAVLLEAGDFCEGTSGRNHGMLHSGARYAVRDPPSARECASEGRVLKHVAPYCIEDTGGIFVSSSCDDQTYIDTFVPACRSNGVRTEEITVKEARLVEPALGDISQAVEVDDASIDPFALVLGNIESARQANAVAINHARVTSMRVGEDIEEVTFALPGGRERTVKPELVINAAGAHAPTVAAMAGCHLPMRWDKGTLVVMEGRTVSTLINRLRPPSDGDILVPSHGTCVLGTTSTPVSSPDDTMPTAEEVDRMVRGASEVLPFLRSARMIRAFSGVRPLLRSEGEGRDATRNFNAIMHTSPSNLISVTGGKLTTYRLMAERTVDLACRYLSVSRPCRTHTEQISPSGGDGVLARLRARYGPTAVDVKEHCSTIPGGTEIVCTCEGVMCGEIDHFARSSDVLNAADLIRRTRAGMGYCQSMGCETRLVAALDGGMEMLRTLIAERDRGADAIRSGPAMRQEAIRLHLHRVYGVE